MWKRIKATADRKKTFNSTNQNMKKRRHHHQKKGGGKKDDPGQDTRVQTQGPRRPGFRKQLEYHWRERNVGKSTTDQAGGGGRFQKNGGEKTEFFHLMKGGPKGPLKDTLCRESNPRCRKCRASSRQRKGPKKQKKGGSPQMRTSQAVGVLEQTV